MKKILATAAVAALVGVSGSALAGDLYSHGGLKDGPAYAPASSWTGFYLGLGVAAEAVNHDIGIIVADVDGISATGAVGTAQIGYDRQFGGIVAGVFFDYDFGDNVSTDLSVIGINLLTIKQTDSWTIGGRAGYLVSPGTLVYALAGYTETKFEADLGNANLGNDTFTGVSVGGGIETKLGGHWSLKGEYRFTSYDTNKYFGVVSVDTTTQTARASLNYKADFLNGEIPAPLN